MFTQNSDSRKYDSSIICFTTKYSKIFSLFSVTHDQLVVLQELQGHLTLLGPRLEQSLIFSGLRQRLFKGLLISATLEPTKVTESDDPFSFQYLRENRVVSLFAACCFTIGRHGNLSDTSDYLLDVVRQKDSFDKESVYVMNLVLKGNP